MSSLFSTRFRWAYGVWRVIRAQKTDPGGCFPFTKVAPSIFRPARANLANPDDEFQIVFRQLSGLSSPESCRYNALPSGDELDSPDTIVDPELRALRYARPRKKTQWSRLTSSTFPSLRFFHSCYALALSQDLFSQFHRRRVNVMTRPGDFFKMRK